MKMITTRKGRKIHRYNITEESAIGTLLMETCATLMDCLDKDMTRTQLTYALKDATNLIRDVESAVKNVNSDMLAECEVQ